MHRLVLLFCVSFLVLFKNTSNAMSIKTPDLAPGAKSAILFDAISGQTLYEKNADKQSLIASLTKIMTAIVAIEQAGNDLDQLVTIGPNAVGVEGSSLYLKQGEKLPLRSLLYGLMLRSGNDAATAIAEHIGGSVEGFAYLMNQKAAELGLNNTHFDNPSGLDSKTHYSSAKDLAKLAAYAMHNPEFVKIVSSKSATVDWPADKSGKRFFKNKNKLLTLYPFANGVKTGFTKKAGRTLVTAALKDGRQLIAVTLNDGNDWKDHIAMFDYGFSKYTLLSILKYKEPIKLVDPKVMALQENYQLLSGQNFYLTIHNDELEQNPVELRSVITKPLEYAHNTSIGNIRIYLGDELLGSVPILTEAKTGIKPKSPNNSWSSSWQKVWRSIIGAK